MSNRGITVVGVMRELGLEPSAEITWAVGARVRDLYESSYGHLPPKELRAKTNGMGSHCFAIYPDEMRETIERIINAHRVEQSRQQSFEF